MAKDHEIKYCQIGGQGVLEGVMMRAPEKSALAVRRADGSIATKVWDTKKITNKFLRLPLVRGVVSLVDSMYSGVKIISDSARLYDEQDVESYEPNDFEKFIAKKTGKDAMSVMMLFAVIIALVLSVGLFFFLPQLLISALNPIITSPLLRVLVEGVIRILIFIGYLLLCTLMKDIKRVFMYHGAEHKTIACYEAGEPLDVEHARTKRRLHPRCGTSFLLLVMIIAILLYACMDVLFGLNNNLWIRMATRLICLPIIAGISYEVLKLCAKYENWFTKALRWPGMQLQRLTTKEPTDDILEIGILAFELALNEKSEEELEALKHSFEHIVPVEEQEKQEKQPVTEDDPDEAGEN